MTDSDLSAAIENPETFFSLIRSKKGEATKVLAGRFEVDKKPYLHAVTLEDGSKITFKFVDTIKYLLDHKMRRIHGRDSFLSYLEIIAQPAGKKAYSRTFDIKQVVIAVPRETSEAKHRLNVAKLAMLGQTYEIDLTPVDAWYRIYDESYRR